MSSSFFSQAQLLKTTIPIKVLTTFIIVLVSRFGFAFEQVDEHRWANVDKIVVFADVHGAYDELVNLLQQATLIDEDLLWIGGATHLVSLGDLLDRGSASRQVLDLLIRLESEAEQVGGKFHLVLGNHEVMNLIGDLRYVSTAEYAAFATPETTSLRSQARKRFIDRLARQSPESISERESITRFNSKFPIGFFGHRAAFAKTGEYGRWLLGKPQLIVINNIAFVHGGLSADIQGKSLTILNKSLGHDLNEMVQLRYELQKLGCIHFDQTLEETLASPTTAACKSAGLMRLAELDQGAISSESGPTWYRGNSLCHELLEFDQFQTTLDGIQVERLIVGHSITDDRRVQTRFGGRLIMLDTGMLQSHYRGNPAILLVQNSSFHAIYADGTNTSLPGNSSTHANSLTMLSTGVASNPAVQTQLARGVPVSVTTDETELDAYFVPLKAKLAKREVAAFQLDQLLTLNLISPTIQAEFRGEQGILIARGSQLITENHRQQQQLIRSNWCGRGNVYQLMYAFDVLINNKGRHTENIAYKKKNWQLVLSEHTQTFSRGTHQLNAVQESQQVLPLGLAKRLRWLTDEKLEQALQGLLNKSQITALGKRRDLLLSTWQIAD